MIPVPIRFQCRFSFHLAFKNITNVQTVEELVAHSDKFLSGFCVVQTTMSQTICYRLANELDENVKKLNIKLYLFFNANTTQNTINYVKKTQGQYLKISPEKFIMKSFREVKHSWSRMLVVIKKTCFHTVTIFLQHI